MNDQSTLGAGLRLTTIRVRLALAFAALILLLVIASALFAWRFAQVEHLSTSLVTEHLRLERLLGDWVGRTRTALAKRAVIVRTSEPELAAKLEPDVQEAIRRINELQKQIEELATDEHGRAAIKEAMDKRKAFLEVDKEVIARKNAGDRAGAIEMQDTRSQEAMNAYMGAVEGMRDYYQADGERQAAEIVASAAQTRRMLIAFCVAGVLLGALASWLIARSINRPIEHALDVARRVADGDLAIAMASTGGRDEMAQLLGALDEMARKLRELLGEVAQGAHSVADSSAQIAQGNTDLSQRTEEQAATLEETAGSMEEFTSTVEHNAEHARVASQLAAEAVEVARQGGGAVADVVATMNAIAASSRKIAEITGLIDGIAFQTNILALNAAVEAARAGELGRGFAVVATEVRSLAQRSAQAAREIKALIAESVRQAEAGTGGVDVAGRKMNEIVDSVSKVSSHIAEIAAASREQSAGIGQVNIAVSQLDQVTQQNASLVEEAAAATESLKGQADALLVLVSRFRITQSPVEPMPMPGLGLGRAPARAQVAFRRAVGAQRAPKLTSAGGPQDWREF
jgi:methyl-accepting chemotaxis protein